MAFSAKAGSFATPTATGSQAITGLGFSPVMLLLIVSVVKTDGTIAAHVNGSLGFAGLSSGGSIQQSSVRFRDTDNAATSSNQRGNTSGTDVVRMFDSSATTSILVATTSSFDVDGFTLNWTTVDAANAYLVSYLALGGSDFTDTAHSGQTPAPAATGSQSTLTGTDTRFGLLPGTFIPNASAGTNVGTGGLTFAVGMYDYSGNQRAVGVGCAGGLATMDTCGRQIDTKVHGPVNANVEVPGQAALTAVTSTNYTLNWTSITNRNVHMRMHGKGTFVCKIGTETSKTSTGTKATTGLGFAPKGLLAIGRLEASSTSINSGAYISFGLADGTNQRTISFCSEDATANAQCDSYTNASFLARIRETTPGSPVVVAEASVSSFDSDGFTLNWSTADATAREFYYIAFGDSPPSDITVTPGVAQASAAGIAPTILAGDVTPVPGVAQATANAIDTEVQNATLVTPGVAEAIAAGVDLVIIAGAVSLAPDVANAISAASGVTIVAGEVSSSPTVAIATAGCVDTIVDASVSLTPGVAEASASGVDPFVVAGAVSASPGVASASSSATSPMVIPGAVSLTPGVAYAATSAVDLVIDASTTLTPGVAAAIASGVDLSAMPGAVVNALGVAQAFAIALGPTLIIGPVNVAVTSIALAAASAVDTVVVVLPLVFGPYTSLASQFFVCGSVSGQGFVPSSLAGQCSAPLSVAGQAWIPGSAARQSFTPGSEGGQAR